MKGKQPMLHNAALISSGTLLALVLTACGGGGGSSNNGGGGGDTDTSQFTASATWTFDLPGAGQDACYDFDNALQTADCSSTDWDLMVRSSGLTATFWTNSGTTNAAGPGRRPQRPVRLHLGRPANLGHRPDRWRRQHHPGIGLFCRCQQWRLRRQQCDPVRRIRIRHRRRPLPVPQLPRLPDHDRQQ